MRGEEGGLQNSEKYEKVKKENKNAKKEEFGGAKSQTETNRRKSIEKGTKLFFDGGGRESHVLPENTRKSHKTPND